MIILSPSKSGSKTSYRLEWTADSRTPISLLEVAVKKAGQGEWKKHNVIVDIPEVSDDENVIEEHSLELTGLEPSTLYQVTVASRNNFGLSRRSQIFTFSTKAAGQIIGIEKKTGKINHFLVSWIFDNWFSTYPILNL